MVAEGSWKDERGVNLLDTGAPFYGTYEASDRKHLAIAPLEPQFFAQFLYLTGLQNNPAFKIQSGRTAWPAMRQKLTALYMTNSRDEWCTIFDRSDACVTPVLSMAEARQYSQNLERKAFIAPAGVPQPAPAPRFSLTTADEPVPPRPLGTDTTAVLVDIGYDEGQIADMRDGGVIG